VSLAYNYGHLPTSVSEAVFSAIQSADRDGSVSTDRISKAIRDLPGGPALISRNWQTAANIENYIDPDSEEYKKNNYRQGNLNTKGDRETTEQSLEAARQLRVQLQAASDALAGGTASQLSDSKSIAARAAGNYDPLNDARRKVAGAQGTYDLSTQNGTPEEQRAALDALHQAQINFQAEERSQAQATEDTRYQIALSAVQKQRLLNSEMRNDYEITAVQKLASDLTNEARRYQVEVEHYTRLRDLQETNSSQYREYQNKLTILAAQEADKRAVTYKIFFHWNDRRYADIYSSCL
jgi:hypothetical protein